jgi:hypothetical protein
MKHGLRLLVSKETIQQSVAMRSIRIDAQANLENTSNVVVFNKASAIKCIFINDTAKVLKPPK